MGLGHGAGIIRNGLVLYLDAANRKSYPGTGTTWSDLSGKGNNALLLNGPTYSSTNQGNISFDNANDYCEVTNRNSLLEFQPTQPFTLAVWFKATTAPTSGSIISNMVSVPPYTGYDLWFNGSNQIASHVISSWTTNAVKVKIDYNYSNLLNTWAYMAVTYDGSSPTTSPTMVTSMDFYINGALYTTGKSADAAGADGFDTNSSSIPYTTTQRFRVASRWSNNALSQGSPIAVSKTMVYNRKLSAAEIKQNFNATRGRYGV